MPTTYCNVAECSNFRDKPTRILGGRSFLGYCNLCTQEIDENGVCFESPNKSVELNQADLCDCSGLLETLCNKDNCNEGCISQTGD